MLIHWQQSGKGNMKAKVLSKIDHKVCDYLRSFAEAIPTLIISSSINGRKRDRSNYTWPSRSMHKLKAKCLSSKSCCSSFFLYLAVILFAQAYWTIGIILSAQAYWTIGSSPLSVDRKNSNPESLLKCKLRSAIEYTHAMQNQKGSVYWG